MKITCALLASTAIAASASMAVADDWWPFSIATAVGGDLTKVEKIDYAPLDKAEKAWNLCVLFPHLQDSYWLSVNYGIAEEAKRLGVKFTLLQAGGYSNLPKQISQYDDCVAAGASAILIGAISEAGLAAKITEGMGKGIVNIAVANPILETPITARITPTSTPRALKPANSSRPPWATPAARRSASPVRKARAGPRPTCRASATRPPPATSAWPKSMARPRFPRRVAWSRMPCRPTRT